MRVCGHLITGPSVGKGGPQPLDADHLLHVFIRRIRGNGVMIGQLVFFHDAYRHSRESERSSSGFIAFNL